MYFLNAGEMSEAYTRRVLDTLKAASEPLSTQKLAHAVGVQTRKQINPTLYALEREGKIRKSGDAPAMWSLNVRFEDNSHKSAMPTAGGGVVGRGAAYRSAQRDVISQHYQSQQQEVAVGPSEIAAASTSSTGSQSSGIEGQVLGFLCRTPKACTALEIAKALGYQTSTDVKPHLYAMAKDGLISRVEGQRAPQWSITTNGQQKNAQPTISHSTSLLSIEPSMPMATSAADLSTIPCSSPGTSQMAASGSGSPVSLLSEYCQSKQLQLSFPVVEEDGPPHRKTFVIAAKFGSQQFEAESFSKKEAKRMAADHALQSIRAIASTSGPSSSITDLTQNPVSSLLEYCQSKQLDLSFPVVGEDGPPHRKTFLVAAKFGSQQFEAQSSNKKEAKRLI